MTVTLLFVFLTVAGLATGSIFTLQNRLSISIWVGIRENPVKGNLDFGGFQLAGGEVVSTELEREGGGVACGLLMGRYYTGATGKNKTPLNNGRFYISHVLFSKFFVLISNSVERKVTQVVTGIIYIYIYISATQKF
jgi:hypothetical protein